MSSHKVPFIFPFKKISVIIVRFSFIFYFQTYFQASLIFDLYHFDSFSLTISLLWETKYAILRSCFKGKLQLPVSFAPVYLT